MQSIIRRNKIVVALSHTKDGRDKLLRGILVNAGFARIESDAAKIIAKRVRDIDLDSCFFVAAADFRFQDNYLITQRLMEFAIKGIPVFVSCRHVPNIYLPFCEIAIADI